MNEDDDDFLNPDPYSMPLHLPRWLYALMLIAAGSVIILAGVLVR